MLLGTTRQQFLRFSKYSRRENSREKRREKGTKKSKNLCYSREIPSKALAC